MIHQIAYTLILGKPIIMYLGILTYLSLLFTAFISVSNVKFGIHIVPFKWHPRLAAVTIILATVHAILGLSLYFGF
jgi:hypothetical protein